MVKWKCELCNEVMDKKTKNQHKQTKYHKAKELLNKYLSSIYEWKKRLDENDNITINVIHV